MHEFELVEAQYKYANILTLARGEASRRRRSISPEAKYLTEKETVDIILIVSKTNYKTE
jgi:hypothetical protein